MIKYQEPAQGIMKTNDWGNSKAYRVSCDCGSDDHVHDFWVEADDNNVTVTLYTKVKTKFWKLNRWQQIWQLLTKGYLDYEGNIILTSQQAFNYAETLKKAIVDIEELKKSNKT